MKKILIPQSPRFLFAPDGMGVELYIVCTKPLALIYVHQSTPAQLYIINGPQKPKILMDAGDWFREQCAKKYSTN